MRNSTTLIVEDTVNPAEWDQAVIRLNGCCFHCHQWTRHSAENNRAKPLFFKLNDQSGNTLALAFGLLRTKKIGPIGLNEALSLGSLPAVADTGLIGEMIKSIIGFCEDNKVVELGINSFGTPVGSEILREFGFSLENRWEFPVDISGTEDELWNRLHSKKRNLIRKARKENLSAAPFTAWENVLDYQSLAVETASRKNQQGIDFPEVRDEMYFRLLKKNLFDTGLGRLYLAYDNDQAVAGAIFAGFHQNAYYMLSAANDRGLQKAGPDLILWTAMTDYQREVFCLFNLGGVSEHDLAGETLEKSGLYHFKKRFPADAVPCFKGKLTLRPSAQRKLSFLRKAKAMFG